LVKPRFMKVYEAALYPFSILYDGVTRLRNHLYELEIKKSSCFTPVLINTGNLAVGGTGKTPMVEYLIRLLKDEYELATLSRGYGRSTSGFRLAGEEDSANSLGDEPFQIYNQWKRELKVAVGEQRAAAIPKILFEYPEVEVILLDDAYQHRAVQPDCNILLTTWQRPFFRDYVLPAGRLREARKGAERAQMVVVTKCPARLSDEQKAHYRKQISLYTGAGTPVFFSTLAYDAPYELKSGKETALPASVVLVSGLAKADLLEEEVQRHTQVVKHYQYADHHRYAEEEIKEVIEFTASRPGCGLVTSSKDAVKWMEEPLKRLIEQVPVYILPVRHQFMEGEEAFKDLILKTIAEKKKV
jgi:tetraacyldisaccharide 4'-kinase